MKTLMRSLASIVIVAAGMVPVCLAQESAANKETPAKKDVPLKEFTKSATTPRDTRLTDAQIAMWLLIDNEQLMEVSSFAAEYATADSVKNFARSIVEQHGRLATKLHAPIKTTLGRTEEESVNIGEVFSQIADRLESQRLREGEQLPLRQIGERAEERREDRADLRQDVREVREDRREAVEEAREDVDEARRESDRRDRNRQVQSERDDLRETRREELADSRDTIQDRRQEGRSERREEFRGENDRRDRVRRVLPILADSLPEIIDAVGAAIEEAEHNSNDLAVLHFKHDIGLRNIERLKKELQAKQDHFDEAYLGYALLAHIEMIDSLEIASQRASATLRPTLNESVATLQQHLTHAQSLMKQAEADPQR